ncbi:SURF1 family protein [Aestuariivirga sp.]|uniref:SURF1 family protein n=1 Tax=Aestuariivirga sp. TaxID=2650926 RepID=UPI003BAA18AD
MRPHERPPRIWPVVLATLVGVAILLWLGVWQVQRLHWKEGLLAQLAANAAAAPVDLSTAAQMAADGRDDEFVRVRFSGQYKNDAWKKMISTYDGGQGWTIMTPAISDDGWAVIVDRGRVPGQRLEHFEVVDGPTEIEGVIRTYKHGPGYFDPANDPKANLWFWWDVKGMLDTSALAPGLKPFPYVVQLLPESTKVEFPRPEEPKANLANNHLGYAITWFGLALTLIGVSGVYIYDLRKQRRR